MPALTGRPPECGSGDEVVLVMAIGRNDENPIAAQLPHESREIPPTIAAFHHDELASQSQDYDHQ
ncbi:hypothetical protein ACH4KN_28080 [Streptomyces sp. NPDC017546]|uniref:hypothetical protein n=1 Tax=unclassified Streptomyces TaxID=2593676 RepID=UPI00235F0539|nr:hypothetical protein [Streptomyces sp. MMBL 11-1]